MASGTVAEANSRQFGASGSNLNSTDINVTDAGSYVDPASLATVSAGDGNSGEPAKRRRGRPPGSGSKSGTTGSKKEKNPPNLGFLSGALMTVHAGLAAGTGIPEFALEQEEADKLTQATSKLASHYGVEVSEKTDAWLSFASAISQVYGTRMISIYATAKAKKDEPQVKDNAVSRPYSVVG